MTRWCLSLALGILVTLTSWGPAADTPVPVASAHGKIIKVDKDTLTIQPRGDDGKFAKPIVLTLTGTSRFSTVTTREQAGKTIIVQKDTQARELQPDQLIAITFATLKDDKILLTGAVQPEK